MEQQLCKCGCGETLPETNKSGFKWGHKGKQAGEAGSNQAAEPSPEAQPEASAQPEVETTAPEQIECLMTEAQLERIWLGLPLHEKAVAMLTALSLER